MWKEALPCPQLLVPSSALSWLGSGQGQLTHLPGSCSSRGDEHLEAYQHCQPKSVLAFYTEVLKNKHSEHPGRAGGQKQSCCPQLVWFMLFLEPHLLISASCLLTLGIKDNGSEVSSLFQYWQLGVRMPFLDFILTKTFLCLSLNPYWLLCEDTISHSQTELNELDNTVVLFSYHLICAWLERLYKKQGTGR